MNFPPHRPCSSRFLSLLDRLRRLASPTHSVAVLLVVRLSPHLRYYPAVRPLPEHRFSFHLRLWSRFPRCHPRTLEVLLGSRPDLPYRAVRKHLGAVASGPPWLSPAFAFVPV